MLIPMPKPRTTIVATVANEDSGYCAYQIVVNEMKRVPSALTVIRTDTLIHMLVDSYRLKHDLRVLPKTDEPRRDIVEKVVPWEVRRLLNKRFHS